MLLDQDQLLAQCSLRNHKGDPPANIEFLVSWMGTVPKSCQGESCNHKKVNKGSLSKLSLVSPCAAGPGLKHQLQY